MKKNKIAVIGGTGKAGKYLVNELLKQDFSIKLLIRTPEKLQIQNPLMESVVGNVNNYQSVKSVLSGCEAVISTLGLGQPNSGKNIFTTATKNILKVMEEFKIRRYIVVTGLNVDTPYDLKSKKTQDGTDWMKTHFPETTHDKQLEYEILANSNADWTLIRLPLIEQTDQGSTVGVSLTDCPGEKISATDLATFLIEQISSKEYIRESPFISNI